MNINAIGDRFGCRMASRGGTLLLATLALAILTGCSKTTQTRVPDSSGTHLLVFASDRNQSTGQFDIYLYDLDALGFRLISNLNSISVADLNPTITPEGRVIAFQSNRGGSSGSDILLYDRAIANFVTAPGVNTVNDETDPAFSHDGRYLAFTRTIGGLKQIELDDGLKDTLVALPGLNTPTSNYWAPSPNESASLVAFVTDRNGNPDVMVYSVAGDSLFNLPDLASSGTDTDPWLTPDGHYLCFASDRSGGAGGLDLYLYDLPARTFVTLAPTLNTDKTERGPTLSNDGHLIVFESDRTSSLGGMDLWNYNRTTGQIGQAPLESSISTDQQPFLLYP